MRNEPETLLAAAVAVTDVCGDHTVHASQRKSVAGRAGAVDGLLHHVGGKVPCVLDSSNIDLEDGLRF